jgi:predicted dehydrogenase
MNNTEIKAAIVGFGGISRSHKRAYDALRQAGFPVNLVAICDIDPGQFSKALAINIDGSPKCDISAQHLYTSLDEMLEKEDFDMADICLPSYLHKEYTERLLRAGKHVLCEKPMALSSADCADMIKAARECNRKLMVGQCLRFEPLYLFLKEAIENNTFGRLKAAYFYRLSSPPHWGFEGWYRDTKRSGGAIMDLHIHDVDMVRFLFGEPGAVSAITYDTFARWAVVNSRFMYGDDRIIVADASWDEARSVKFSMSYRVRFEQATVKLEGGVVTVYPEEGTPYTPELPRTNRMVEQLRTFVTTILQSRGNEVNPPESAMMTVRLVEKLRESADNGGVIVNV